jgi:methionyl-tRNA formyltransferase
MRVVFMGTPESAVPSLSRLVEDGHDVVAVWTQPDKPAGRGKKLHASPVKEFALKQGLTVYQPAKVRTSEAKELFASHRADVAVVVAYGRILPSEFLSSPANGCVNVHFSLLPKYRGAAPVNWAIVNGETETGVTTMNIVEELDAGPILLQSATRIDRQETAPELLQRLSQTGSQLLIETLANLKQIQPKPQSDAEATFAPILKREHGLIDWSQPAFAIEQRVRGFQPWPNAFTQLNAKRLIVWRASVQPGDHAHSPGQVVTAQGDALEISCGENTILRLLEVQPESGRRMTAREFLAGARITPGLSLRQS